MLATCNHCSAVWERSARGVKPRLCPPCATSERLEQARTRTKRDQCSCGRLKTAVSRQCRICADVLRASPYLVPRNCDHCGKCYNPTVRCPSRFCSVTCSGAYFRQPDTRDRLRRRRGRYSRRRQLMAKAGKAVVGRWRRICARDGWVCWICGGEIDPAISHPHRLGGTVDHVIPLAEGGSDADDNCRAAHMTCNSRRGHSPSCQFGMPFGVSRGKSTDGI